MKKILTYLIILFGINHFAFAQETKVKGTVVDALDKQPVPFANVAFSGTAVGTITSANGTFFLSTKQKVDTLIVSFIGYKTEKIAVKRGAFQNLEIILSQDNISLDEVVVVPGENPAFSILRKINKHKKRNNPDKLKKYSCTVYNKVQVDANNLTEDFKKKKLLKKFSFVFDYMDTSVVTGKNYLPILISETYSDFYYRKNPHSEKEYVKAYQLSGIDNESISQYTGQMYQKVNIYDNYINIFERSFVSPIASFGRTYYKYYLVDSNYIDNKWCYQISYTPKFKQEPTFEGYFWVTDTSFAIKSIKMSLSKHVNVNLIQNFYMKQSFKAVQDSSWMITDEKMVADFNIAKKTMGFFIRKNTHYSNFNISENISDTVFSTLNSRMSVLEKGAKEVDKEQWSEIRPEKLNDNEQGIYEMVDSIKNVPIFTTYVDIIKTLFSGFYKFGKIELGDYTSVYSYNDIEGSRFKIMARTSTEFSDKVYLDGHLAYGVRDEKFKYGLGAKYYFRKDLTRVIGFKYKKDLEQLGISPYTLPSDNLLNALFSRTGAANKLTNIEKINIFYKHEWFLGFANTLSLNYKIMSPHEEQGLTFKPIDDVDGRNEIIVSEVSLNTRIAFNENTIMGREHKVFIASKYPVISINLTVAPKGVINSTYNYQRIQLGWLHTIKFNPFGYFKYYAVAGKIFGTVPYPLLEMHTGNETYWYDDYAFNLMNYYEFISDEWYSLHVEHHFEGFFLNKIPIIKKLKWREVVTFKGVYGTMTDENKAYSEFPSQVEEVKNPYMEASLGIENIFTLLRVDALWRLSHLDQPNISKFGIRVKIQFEF